MSKKEAKTCYPFRLSSLDISRIDDLSNYWAIDEPLSRAEVVRSAVRDCHGRYCRVNKLEVEKH